MHLKADAVDRHLGRLQPAHDLVQPVGLRADALRADLVDVELGLRVGGARRVERPGDEAGAQAAQEDRLAQPAVVGDDLVDDIPDVHHPGIAVVPDDL